MNEKDLFAKIMGIKLKRIRLEKGLSQEQFGNEVSLDGNNFGRIERGENLPSAMTLFRLSKNKISIDKLFNEIEQEMEIYKKNDSKKP